MTLFDHGLKSPGTRCHVLRIAKWAILLIPVLISAFAGTEYYDYDAAGRLQRVTDEQRVATRYQMDAADNLLSVGAGDRNAAPVIESVTPAGLRRGQTRTFTITGQHLDFVSLSTGIASLSIAGLVRSPTRISFSLTAASDAPVGPQTLTFRDAVGSAGARIIVSPALPLLSAEPAPLALPPDGSPRQLTLRLSGADNVDHLISLRSLEPTIAALGTNTVTIPAGQMLVRVPVTGKSAGTTSLVLTADELAGISLPVFVTGEFRGLSTSHAAPVGVVRPQGPPAPVSVPRSANSPAVGILRGTVLLEAQPSVVNRGSQGLLVIKGAAIPRNASLSALPAQGLSFGTPVVADDGTSLSVPYSVAADASLIDRELRVQGGGGLLTWVDARRARLGISLGAPQVDSVRPYYAVPGRTVALVVGGRHFDQSSMISITPSSGLTVEAPSVNADGTELSLRVQIASEATPGTRLLTVTTRAGTSSSEPGPANSFQLLENDPQAFAPVGTPLLGVVREIPPVVQRTSQQAVSSPIGIAIGGVANRLLPRAAIVGQVTRIRIEGYGLQAVDNVQLLPATGLSVGRPQPADDGNSLTIDVTAAADAPRVPRQVLLRAGTTRLSFAPTSADQLVVSEPLPELYSVSPNVAAPGITMLTLRGINLQNAQQLSLLPSAGISVDSLSSSSDGRTVTARLQVAPAAAPGPRTVVLSTLAGTSDSTPSLANTITLGARAVDGPGPLLSSALRVQRDIAVVPQPMPTDVRSAALGLVRQSQSQPVTSNQSTASPALQVVRGAVLNTLAPREFSAGSSGLLTLRGQGLGANTRVSVLPDTGIRLGSAQVSLDGSVLELPISIDANAPAVPRQVRVNDAQGELLFVDPQAGQIAIGAGAIELLSIDPIIVRQGDTVTLTLRGSRLQSATAVRIEPPEGIEIEAGPPVWSSDALGPKLSPRIRVDAGARLGSRVVRVLSPGSISTAMPLPANTLTVIAP